MFAMHSKAACSAASCYGKSTCNFFMAVSKVSFDAVTSMPGASAKEKSLITNIANNTRNSRNNTTPMTSGTGRSVQHSFAYFCEGFFCNALAGFFIVEAFFALATGFAFALALLFACDFAGLELPSIWLIIIIIMRLAIIGLISCPFWRPLSSPSHSAALELPQWNIANPMVAH